MKILMTQQEYVPSIGGGPISIDKSIRELSSRGIQINLYTTNIIDFKKRTRIGSGTEIEGNLKVIRHNAVILHKHLILDTRLLFSLLRDSSDIIHAHGFGYTSSEIASFAAKLKNIPFIISTHGYFPITMKINRRLTNAYVGLARRTILHNAKYVIVDTEDEKKVYSRICDRRKVAVIPLATISEKDIGRYYDPAPFKSRFGIEGDYFVTIGRITEAKGFQNLIRALPSFYENTKSGDVKFVFIGPDGGYLQSLIALSKRLGVWDHITFTGAVDEFTKNSALSGALSLVIPSYYETFGLVSTEAIALGVPVIVTKFGGAKELVIDGRNGLSVDPTKSNELGDALSWALYMSEADRKGVAEISKRILTENYTIERSAERLARLYMRVLEEAGRD